MSSNGADLTASLDLLPPPRLAFNEVTLQSEILGRGVKLRISAAALRTVDHRGGLDAFLVKAKDKELSANALKIKKEIFKAQEA